MPILHMDPDLARDAAAKLSQTASAMQAELHSLSRSLSNLAANWSGPDSTWFVADVQGTLAALMGLADEATMLSLRLQAEVEAWETVDQHGAATWPGIVPPLVTDLPAPPLDPPPDTPTPPDEPKPEEEDDHPRNGPHGIPSGHNDDRQDDGRQDDDQEDEALQDDDATEDHQQDDNRQPAPPQGTEQIKPKNTTVSTTTTTVARITAVAGSVAAATTTTAASTPSTGIAASTQGSWNKRLHELDKVDKEIKHLEAMPNRSPEGTARLHELHNQRNQLEQAVNEGIVGKGLNVIENPFPSGECTWYATSRNNLYPHVYGHAKFWGEQAAAAGLEVGELPVRGAVMVWQPGVFKADAQFGHVSFVERVERMLDGSYKVYYTDNDNMNPATPRSIIVQAGEVGVSFIYGK